MSVPVVIVHMTDPTYYSWEGRALIRDDWANEYRHEHEYDGPVGVDIYQEDRDA
mgnify:CR=1 FL=1